jgi:5-methyltetrahydrofolate--homocysteine methyltransferase
MMDAGMNSAIIDPLGQNIMATIRTADMLLLHDDFCMTFLKEVRSGAIKS